MKYVLSSTVTIFTDDISDQYKTEASVNINDNINEEDLHRDIIFALIVELKFLYKKIKERANITDDEIDTFIKDRKSSVYKEIKLRDDDVIQHLFDDEN